MYLVICNHCNRKWISISLLQTVTLETNATGNFRVSLCLCFKTSLCAKPFLWKWETACRTHFHVKGFARSLVLIQRQKVTVRHGLLIFHFAFVLQKVISDRVSCFTIDYTVFIRVKHQYTTSKFTLWSFPIAANSSSCLFIRQIYNRWNFQLQIYYFGLLLKATYIERGSLHLLFLFVFHKNVISLTS